MLLKHVRLFFRDKRCDPYGRLKASLANLFEHTLHVAAECGTRLEPITHRRLVAVVDLYVTQTWNVFRDEVEIVEHLLRRNAWAKAVPRTPTGGWVWKTQPRMTGDEPGRQILQQALTIISGFIHERFELPRFAGSQLAIFGVDDDFQRLTA